MAEELDQPAGGVLGEAQAEPPARTAGPRERRLALVLDGVAARVGRPD